MPSTIDRLLTATNELFRRHGYRGTSVKQVIDAADAPNGSLYHFFPDGKEQLGAAALRASGEAYRQLFELIADAAASPAAAMTDFFDGAADAIEEAGFIELCPIGSVAREMANASETIRVASADVFDGWSSALSQRFAAAGLAPDVARDLATTAIAAIEGGFLLALTHRDGDRLRTIGRHVRTVVEAELAQNHRVG